MCMVSNAVHMLMAACMWSYAHAVIGCVAIILLLLILNPYHLQFGASNEEATVWQRKLMSQHPDLHKLM